MQPSNILLLERYRYLRQQLNFYTFVELTMCYVSTIKCLFFIALQPLTIVCQTAVFHAEVYMSDGANHL